MTDRLPYLDGVAVQPDRLEASQRRLREVIETVPTERLTSGTIGLVGMGASLYAALSAVPDFRGRVVRAHAISATDLCDDAVDAADNYIAISASGRSRETVEAMAKAPSGYRIGVTRDADSPLARCVDTLVPTFSGDDTSPCTVSYTGTLQALGLLAARAGGRPAAEEWRRVPALVAQVLADATEAVEAAAAALAGASSIDLVGRGVSYGSAGEAALLLREKARVPSSVHDTLNYLHGPMESLEAGIGVIVIGDGREVQIARDVASFGCATLLLTRRGDVATEENLTVLRLPEGASGLAAAVIEIVPLQLLTARLAAERGQDALDFRYRQTGTKIEA